MRGVGPVGIILETCLAGCEPPASWTNRDQVTVPQREVCEGSADHSPPHPHHLVRGSLSDQQSRVICAEKRVTNQPKLPNRTNQSCAPAQVGLTPCLDQAGVFSEACVSVQRFFQPKRAWLWLLLCVAGLTNQWSVENVRLTTTVAVAIIVRPMR